MSRYQTRGFNRQDLIICFEQVGTHIYSKLDCVTDFTTGTTHIGSIYSDIKCKVAYNDSSILAAEI